MAIVCVKDPSQDFLSRGPIGVSFHKLARGGQARKESGELAVGDESLGQEGVLLLPRSRGDLAWDFSKRTGVTSNQLT